MRKLSRQFLIGIERWPVGKLLEDPGSVPSLPGKGCADPVVHSCRYDPDRLRRLGLFPKYQECIGALSFARRTEALHLVQGYRIQIQVIHKGAHVPRLLADDLGAGVLEDARAMLPRLELGSYKVLHRLADSPNAGIPFPPFPEELSHFRSER